MEFPSLLSTEALTLLSPDSMDINASDCMVSPKTLSSENLQLPNAEHNTSRKARHYERQRHEKEKLNKELVTLGRILEKVNKKTTMTPPADTKQTFLWKGVAKHRERQLRVSEAQREWLSRAISGKKALIEDLKCVVRQYLLIADLTSPWSRHVGLFNEPPDELVYAMDLHDIDNLYRQTDSVFDKCGLDPLSTETTSFLRTVTASSDGVSVKLVRRQNFLFWYEQARQSIWMHSHFLHRQEDREDYAGNDDPENTIATKFRVTKQLPGGTYQSLKERLVSRQFQEENRTVLIWKTSLIGEGFLSEMRTEETGWAIIRPTATGCVADTCKVLASQHLHDPNAVHTDPFIGFLRSIIQEDNQAITNGSTALLVEKMLAGIPATDLVSS